MTRIFQPFRGRLLFLIAALAVIAAGCGSKGDLLKRQVLEALDKHQQLSAYRFDGEARWQIGGVTAESGRDSGEPFAKWLAAALLNGSMEWTGLAKAEPAAAETVIRLLPANATAPLTVPVLIQDNKMYLHIPLINGEGEYMETGLPNESSAGWIGGARTLTAAIAELADAVDAEWFVKSGALSLEDGEDAAVIEIRVTEQNREELTARLRANLPDIVDLLAAGGLLTNPLAEQAKRAADSFALPTGRLAFAVDSNGDLRQMEADLGITGENREIRIFLRQTYEAAPADAEFSLKPPEKTKKLEELLNVGNGG